MGQPPIRLLTPVEVFVIALRPVLAREEFGKEEWLVAGVVARRARRPSFVVGRDKRV
jgi:hypothetical protein